MSDAIQFDTPENVALSFEPAGLGTRFLAWLVDQIILWLLTFLLFIVLAITGALSESVLRDVVQPVEQIVDEENDPTLIGMYFVGVAMLVWGLGSFVYFAACELCWRGQTIGKRMSQLRVVKRDGFALDAMSVLVRNVFRVVDHLPPLWLVPLVSKQSQRFGDMVSGTVVVSDAVHGLAGVREVLSNRNAADAQFRFDAGMLKKLRPEDIHAVEQLLERWTSLAPMQQQALVTQIVTSICKRVGSEPPEEQRRRQFLQDLLAADYRRQARHLG